MTTTLHYETTWDLDVLLPKPGTDDFRHGFEAMSARLADLAQRSDTLPSLGEGGDVAGIFREFLGLWAEAEALYRTFDSLVHCHASADAAHPEYKLWEARSAANAPHLSRVQTNLGFAFREASESDFEAFLASEPYLRENAFFLRTLRANARLRLPKAEESLASELAIDGLHAWSRLYDRLSGDLRVTVMERGELVQKSPGQVRLDLPDRTARENHHFALQKAWGSLADTCADALNHISGTRLTIYRRLGLEDHLDAPLCHNHMRRETLTALWQAVEARKPSLARFLDRKAELLGLERLSWYDLDAPLPGSSTTAGLGYDEACDLVVSSFDGFSDDLGAFARRALGERWVEAEDRTGKRQGGFCTGFPSQDVSRVFMTFTGNLDSASTLAHELGHAYHSHVLNERPYFLKDYPMNLAETASTFAEAVMGEALLARARTDGERRAVLDRMLTDAVAFLMNVHARFLFEDRFHHERAQGELSAARFTELMLAAQREAYADRLDPSALNPTFWVSKLHFYIGDTPFYNFPYTFGYLLSLGVYALADELGDGFPERYRALLLATGCMETEAAVKSTFGYDLSDGSFWNKALDVVDRRLEAFLG